MTSCPRQGGGSMTIFGSGPAHAGPPPRPERLHVILPLLVETMPALLDQVARLLREQWPEYAEFLDEHRDEVAAGGAIALSRIVEMAEQPGQPFPHASDEGGDEDVVSVLFAEIGRAQVRQGSSLNRLLSAYQTGARAAWGHI